MDTKQKGKIYISKNEERWWEPEKYIGGLLVVQHGDPIKRAKAIKKLFRQ